MVSWTKAYAKMIFMDLNGRNLTCVAYGIEELDAAK